MESTRGPYVTEQTTFAMEGVQPKEDKQSTHVKIVNKKQAYFCSNCDFPSDEIGLLQPCKHVFCLSCSSLMSDCAMYVVAVLYYQSNMYIYDD